MFLHVAVTGQEPEAADLPAAFTFPTMAQLGMGLATVLDHFKVKMSVGLLLYTAGFQRREWT